MKWFLICLGLSLPAFAARVDPGGIGYWQFKLSDRPVKAVIIGASISAYTAGNYGQFLQAACSKLEVVNKAKSKLGAYHLYQRFNQQVVQNPRLKKQANRNFWLVFLGGLNSVGSPQATNQYVLKTFVAAHEAGLKVLALSLLPWGDEKDRRWRSAKGLKTWNDTKLVVEFVLGSLTPTEALGLQPTRRSANWLPAEIPDIAVNLYDSELRARHAQQRSEKYLAAKVKADFWVKRQLADVPIEDRPHRLASFVADARNLPQWFLRRDLQYMDHFHPSRAGHRIIAKKACPTLPKGFGCDCSTLDALVWQRGRLELR